MNREEKQEKKNVLSKHFMYVLCISMDCDLYIEKMEHVLNMTASE